jgi:hypothetical protein
MARHSAVTTGYVVRRVLAAILAAGALAAGGAVAAYADPDFGPGNSSKGPQDPGAICHPPGQTDSPACK